MESQQAFITRIFERGVSRKSVLNILGTLSSILTTARDWGYNCEHIDVRKLRGTSKQMPHAFEAD